MYVGTDTVHIHTDNFWYSEQLQTTGIISPYYRWGN